MSNQSGQSLVQVLVSVAITSIILMITITMLTTQAKESRALGEKLASMDYERFVISTLANPATCNALFNTPNISVPSILTFDATSVTTANPYVLNLNALAGVSPGGLVSPMSSSTFIQSLQLEVTSSATANLLVALDQSKLVRPIQNLSFPIHLQSSGPLTATLISGCQTQAIWPAGNYCLFQNQGRICPVGFVSTNLGPDTSELPSSIAALFPAELLNSMSSAMQMWTLCCK